MNVKINFSNKTTYTFLTIFFLLVGGLLVYSYTNPIPNPGHGADTIWISINGSEKTLQQAVDAGNFAGAGGGTPSGSGNVLTCFDATSCPGSSTTVGPGLLSGTRCCYVQGGSTSFNYDEAQLEIGYDNNGMSDPDCWVISSPQTSQCGQPYLPPGSGGLNCGYTQPGGQYVSCTHQLCVAEALVWYNTQTINGQTGGWTLKDWRDTGLASSCVDGSSDRLAVTLVRNISPLP